MKHREEPEFDDDAWEMDDQVDVDAFLRTVERRDRKRDRIAWREIERRRERRVLEDDLGEFRDD